jgi:hypothetical protein
MLRHLRRILAFQFGFLLRHRNTLSRCCKSAVVTAVARKYCAWVFFLRGSYRGSTRQTMYAANSSACSAINDERVLASTVTRSALLQTCRTQHVKLDRREETVTFELARESVTPSTESLTRTGNSFKAVFAKNWERNVSDNIMTVREGNGSLAHCFLVICSSHGKNELTVKAYNTCVI